MRPEGSECTPPRLARVALRCVVPAARREEVEGDLLELFEERAAEYGAAHARTRYWRDLATVLWEASTDRSSINAPATTAQAPWR